MTKESPYPSRDDGPSRYRLCRDGGRGSGVVSVFPRDKVRVSPSVVFRLRRIMRRVNQVVPGKNEDVIVRLFSLWTLHTMTLFKRVDFFWDTDGVGPFSC